VTPSYSATTDDFRQNKFNPATPIREGIDAMRARLDNESPITADDARWMLDACEILLSFMEAIRQAQAMSILIRLGKANAKTEHLPVLEEGGVS